MDIRTIFQVLTSHGARYILVGALGAVAHGARLRTQDVDICNAADEDNSRRIHAALIDLDAELIRKPPGRDLEEVDMSRWDTLRLHAPDEHHLFTTPYGQIDVLPQPLGSSGWAGLTCYEELLPGVIEMEAFGLRVPGLHLSTYRRPSVTRHGHKTLKPEAS